ncbi:MAG TPA: hypothetical protein VJ765_07405, partial [Chitinophagaceae bacterium]|nr:hypothetical protein [Chitinophagaceae bacterium]
KKKTLLLKQGFYDYRYITVPVKKSGETMYLDNTEGNYMNTENFYLVLVYYRPFGGRSDELVGFALLNSLVSRP